MCDKEKTYGVTLVNVEFLYVTAEDDSKESILDAITAGAFTHVCTDDSYITNVSEIK